MPTEAQSQPGRGPPLIAAPLATLGSRRMNDCAIRWRRSYDNGDTEISDVSLGSRTEGLKYNEDGSIDLYVGPDAPEGLESNHLKTVATTAGSSTSASTRPSSPSSTRLSRSMIFEMIE